MRKIMEEESIADANDVTADTLSHISNTQRDDTKAVFPREKLDESDDLLDALNYLTINDAEYYESNTVTVCEEQGDPTCNPETVTHTSNENETVTNTSNRSFEQKILSNRTIPFIVPATNDDGSES